MREAKWLNTGVVRKLCPNATAFGRPPRLVMAMHSTPVLGSAPPVYVDDALGGRCNLWERSSPLSETWGGNFYPEMLQLLAGVAAADRASLMVLGSSADALVIYASVGLARELAEKTRAPLGGSISGWVANHQRPLLLCPGQDLPEVVLGAMNNPTISSALSVPIDLGDENIGVLNLARCGRRQRFNHSHIQLATLAGFALGTSLRMPNQDGPPVGAERLFSRVLKNIPSPMLVVNRRLQVIAANQEFLKRTRRSSDALTGRQLTDVVPRALLTQARVAERVEQVFRTGHAVKGGRVAYPPHSTHAHAYFVRFVPVAPEASGYVQEVMVLMDDITELERLGAQARQAGRDLAIMEASEDDLMIWLDRLGRVVSWNPAAQGITGRMLEDVRGGSMAELFVDDDRDLCRRALRQVAAGSYVRGLEMMLLGSQRQNVAVSWCCSPIGDDEGKVAGIVALGRDLTAPHQMEQLLIQSDKLASLGVMAGGIAHQLRNPLAIVAMSAELAQKVPADSGFCRECLEKIHASAKRASVVIDELLQFARPQSDKAVVIDVKELLEATFRFTSDQLVQNQVRPRVDVSGNGAKVLGNPVLLQQVFSNLILNACAAMPEGGELTASATSRADGTVSIAFCDTGLGIAPENLPRVFDPFFTTKPPGSGSVGLGLSITYSVVRQLGGSIEVESEPGQGSAFTVVLPRVGVSRR